MNIFKFFKRLVDGKEQLIVEADVTKIFASYAPEQLVRDEILKLIPRYVEEICNAYLLEHKGELLASIKWEEITPLIKGRVLERSIDKMGTDQAIYAYKVNRYGERVF